VCLQDLAISRNTTIKVSTPQEVNSRYAVSANPDRIAVYVYSTTVSPNMQLGLPLPESGELIPLATTAKQLSLAQGLSPSFTGGLVGTIGDITGTLVGALDTLTLTNVTGPVSLNANTLGFTGLSFAGTQTESVIGITVATHPGIVSVELAIRQASGTLFVVEVILDPTVSKAVQEVLQ
jgi:hypothetical protein